MNNRDPHPRTPGREDSPALARALLRLLLRRQHREFFLGDLEEEYHSHVLPKLGLRRARRWYWSQATRSLFSLSNRPHRQRNRSSRNGDGIMQTLWQDIHYGVRLLKRSPGFTAVAVLSLALGIGANATIYSWVHLVLLNPIPGVEATGDLLVYARKTQRGAFSSISYPDFVDFRDRNTTLAGFFIHETYAVSLNIDGASERVWTEVVSGNYFDVLQVRPQLGRTFLPEEDKVPGERPVAVLSHAFWQRKFGGDPNIVGRTIQLNDHPFSVIGVAPEGFFGTQIGLSFDLWTPIMMLDQLTGQGQRLETRGSSWIDAKARLRPGVTREQAQAELNSISKQLTEEFPSEHSDNPVVLFPLAKDPNGAAGVLGPVLLVLMGIVGVVLLIACANIANLLLARATGRRKEIAVRLSLGAGRARLVRQLLTESLLLALLGGILAIVMTVWTSGLLKLFVPPTDAPVDPQLGVNPQVLLFAFLLSIATGLLFGLVPALQATRTNLASALNDESTRSSASRGKGWLRNGLVVAQVSLSLVLLISAGLFIRSLRKAQTFDPGFNAENVLLESVDTFLGGYTPDEGRVFFRELRRRVDEMPGVQAASLTRRIPLGFGGSSTTTIHVENYEPAEDENVFAFYNQVSPDYFRTMEIPLRSGREFSPQDIKGAPTVIIVSETMANRYWKDQQAIGKRIRLGDTWATVVGVAGDIKHRQLNERPRVFMYLALQQFYSQRVTLQVRAQGSSVEMAQAVRGEIQKLNPSLPVFNVTTLESFASGATFQHRLAGNLLGVFGLLALVLASVGIYGVLAYAVGQRTHEIGIRMAMGAQRRHILKLVFRQGAWMLGIGTAIGLAGAFALARVMSGLLFEVSAHDPLTFIATPLVLAAVALLACYLPARRATRVDPMVALRYE